jgi:DNA-binding winged helix-turn-helix (wHTH) protein
MLSFDRLMGVGDVANDNFSEKVNLALRRTAHLLLKSAGDSTSKINPVKNLNDNTFTLRLEKSLNYDLLPNFLAQSFKIHQIESTYNVSVLNCTNGELALGYSFLDFKKNTIACIGRKQDSGCYDLRISFDKIPAQPNAKSLWLIPLWALFLIGFMYFNRKKEEKNPTETEVSDKLIFGNSSLDFANQLLDSGGIPHNLTYREAKLLRLFVNHQNQLLERDFILKSVWEDEGIIVGRSLDVFVSRLRKMLQADASVQINTVHGVGYKLQIKDKTSE